MHRTALACLTWVLLVISAPPIGRQPPAYAWGFSVQAPAQTRPGTRRKPWRSDQPATSVLVCAFRSEAKDPEAAALGEGMGAIVLSKLDNLHQLSLQPAWVNLWRFAERTLKGKRLALNPKEARRLAGNMGVDAVVVGSVRRTGSHFDLAVEVLEVATGKRVREVVRERGSARQLLDREPQLTATIAQYLRLTPTANEKKELAKHIIRSADALIQVGRYRRVARGEEPGKAVDLAGLLKLDPSSPVIQASSAWEYIDCDDLQSALAITKEAVRLNPRHLDLLSVRFWCLKDQNDYGQARRQLKEIEALQPQSFVVSELRCNLLLSQRDYDGLVQEAERLVTLNPNSANAWWWLAWGNRRRAFAARGGKYLSKLTTQQADTFSQGIDRAAEVTEEIVKIAPDFYEGWTELLHIYRETGERKKAERTFAKCEKLNPGDSSHWSQLLWVYREGYEDDPVAFDKLVQSSLQAPMNAGGRVSLARVIMGAARQDSARAKKLYAQAAAQYRRALKMLKPDQPYVDAHHGLGRALLGLGQRNEATREFQIAVAQLRKHGASMSPEEIADRYGFPLLRRKEHQNGMLFYELVLERSPKNKIALANMGGCYFELGNRKQAEARWLQALKLGPDVDALIGAATCRFLRGDRAGAQQFLDRASRHGAQLADSEWLKRQFEWIPTTLSEAGKMLAALGATGPSAR